MIIKCNNKLYNCDGWREISRDDQYVTVEFFEMFTDEDGSKGYCSHVFEIIDDDYYCCDRLLGNDDEFDYKDARQIKYRAAMAAYNVLMQEVKKGTEFIDLDVLLDQEKLCREAKDAYLKEWEAWRE